MTPTTAEILQALRTQREAEAALAKLEAAVLDAQLAGVSDVRTLDLAVAVGLIGHHRDRSVAKRLADLADAVLREVDHQHANKRWRPPSVCAVEPTDGSAPGRAEDAR